MGNQIITESNQVDLVASPISNEMGFLNFDQELQEP